MIFFRRDEDSLKKRFGYKLGANLLGIFSILGTQVIVPRALGPAALGVFGYLTNYFTQVIEFFEAGVTLGFFTKLSQRPKDHGLVRFNWGFLSVVGLLVFIATVVLHLTGKGKSLWLGSSMGYVYLALLWCLLTKVVGVVSCMMDAHGLTVWSEIARNIQRLLGFAVLVIMFMLGSLNLSLYYVHGLAMSIFLIILWGLVLHRNGLHLWPRRSLRGEEVKRYASEMKDYALPLLGLLTVGMFVSLLDRWLLQFFGGSIQQGFYGFSMQMGSLCFVFSTSLSPLLLREFSLAFAQKNVERQRHLFLRLIPPLFSISAFFGLFLSFQSSNVVRVFAGGRYEDARLAVAVMCLYPLHQTYGQLSGSVFYATGRTGLYRNIGIVMAILGLPLTYFLVAPASCGGLNLGALGLAIKTVCLQFFETNIQLWFNARYLGIHFISLLKRQFLVVGILSLFSGGTCWGMRTMSNPMAGFFGAGVIYFALTFVTLLVFPNVFGVKRQDFVMLAALIKGPKS